MSLGENAYPGNKDDDGNNNGGSLVFNKQQPVGENQYSKFIVLYSLNLLLFPLSFYPSD